MAPENRDATVSKRPAGERPGKTAWLGSTSLGLAVVSWLTPIGGEFVAVAALGCGAASIMTRREYRIDWTAVAGICVAAGQLYFALMLFAMSVSGL